MNRRTIYTKYYADGSDEACHGHSGKVEIFLSGKENIRPDGISFDFLTAKRKVGGSYTINRSYSNQRHPDFKGINPTSENIARWFYSGLKAEVKNKGKVDGIVIHEGPENLAYFEPDWEDLPPRHRNTEKGMAVV